MIAIETSGRVPAALSRGVMRRAAAETARVLSKKIRTKKRIVAVAFVTPLMMRRLNRTFRKKNCATDVLSFGMDGDRFPRPPGADDRSLGDIVICPSYARASAATQNVPYAQELVRLLVHGMLHLAGYDHERIKDEKRMFALQEKIVLRVFARGIHH
jgi:probable rRNA maturation factor